MHISKTLGLDLLECKYTVKYVCVQVYGIKYDAYLHSSLVPNHQDVCEVEGEKKPEKH